MENFKNCADVMPPEPVFNVLLSSLQESINHYGSLTTNIYNKFNLIKNFGLVDENHSNQKPCPTMPTMPINSVTDDLYDKINQINIINNKLNEILSVLNKLVG